MASNLDHVLASQVSLCRHAQAAVEDSDAQRRAEREALIQELRASVCELADALQCGPRACCSPWHN